MLFLGSLLLIFGCGGGGGGSSTVATATIQPPTALTYNANPVVYTSGVAIAANSPSNGGGAVTSYSVSPALPAGLILNTTTGIITGIPTNVTAMGTYTVTATNSAGSTSAILTITVSATVTPPTALTYTANPAIYINGVAIAANSPSSSGGAVTSYSVIPDLPAGLALSTTTGVITGTPTAVTATGTYTVTATNSAGSTTANLTITINATAVAPVINTFKASPVSIGLGAGSILTWDVTGANTLSINNGVGTLTAAKGTVNVSPLQSTTFTLSASNDSGTTTATTTVVVDTTPFAITSFNTAGNIIPWGGATTLSWAFNGLPTTLTLNGAPITGNSYQVTPVRRQSYTLAGSNASGADSRSVSVAAQGLDLVAGSGAGIGYKDGIGSSAAFFVPLGVCSDKNGNVYVADEMNMNIRMIAPNGAVTTIAGVTGQSGSTDGPAALARFFAPLGIAVDSKGNLYVADTSNHTVRKISNGTVTTLAGVAGQAGTVDGNSSAARFSAPYGLAVDSSGNVYVADRASCTIRKIDTVGNVTTLAGSPGARGLVDGQGTAARFTGPRALALDAAGNLYISDYNAIRKMTPTGAVTTLAGSISAGSTDGVGVSASFNFVCGLAVDASGNVYVVDRGNQTIRRISPLGFVSTIAGSPGLAAYADGQGLLARFNQPWGIALLPSGNLVIGEEVNPLVRTLTPSGTVGTLAGTPSGYGAADGSGSLAQFSTPVGLAMDAGGNTYVADYTNHTIRKVTPAGVVTTVAGSAGNPGSANGVGSAARFKNPNGVAIDTSGNLYVADYGNSTIRKITPDGTVSTIAGIAGSPGYADGPASSAQFNWPCAVAVGTGGSIYVADTSNNLIRVIQGGYVSTLAGTLNATGYLDGYGSQAQFNQPTGIAVDASNNLYVADSGNNVIRKIVPYGQVTTLAGNPTAFGSADGTGQSALFNYPYTLAVGPSGDIFVSDGLNQTVRKVSPGGKVSTVAGTPGLAQWQPGPLPGTLGNILGVAVSSAGDLMVSIGHAIVQVTAPAPSGAPTIAVQPQGFNVTAGQIVNFSVIASGIAPFTYQWSKNGTAILGATNASYTPPAVSAADDGSSFQVVVSNAYGSVTSTPALLGILTATAPSIMMQPASQSLAIGETTTFTVVATSLTPMAYQWSKNGTEIPGATSPTYTVPAASAADNLAAYTVAITNTVGTTSSTRAILTVIPGTSTIPQAISQAKSTLALLVNTKGNLGTSFFPAQAATLQSDLAGANVSFAFYGRNFKWLRDALEQLLATGGTSLTGQFDTGTYFWSNTGGGLETYPFTLSRSGDIYTYTINGGADGTWSGSIQNLTTWADGSIQAITLVNAAFPGDMTFVYNSTPTTYSYRYAPIFSDVLNVTLSTTPNGTGSDQSVAGTVLRIPQGSSTATLTISIPSATWTEYATGAASGQNHVWLPKHVAMTMTTGTYSFTGTMDCSDYQNNPTAATAVFNGPTWGWPALNSAGATFTSVHFTGATSNGQGGSLSLDLSIKIGNYATILLNQPLSANNAPVVAITATGSLQTPNQPLMTLTVASANQGIFQIPTTLTYTYGTTLLTGTGTYYPPVVGQASGLSFFADLKDQTGTDISLQLSTADVLTGAVSYGGTTIGTISDVGFGPRVLFTDGTFQTLW
jgi:sugar lactone lactonase YvrE